MMKITIDVDPFQIEEGVVRSWLTVSMLAEDRKLHKLCQRPGRVLFGQELDENWGFSQAPENPSMVSLSTAVEDGPQEAIERTLERVREALEAVWL